MRRSPSCLYTPLGDCMVCDEELMQWVEITDQEHNDVLKMEMERKYKHSCFLVGPIWNN